MITKSFYRIEQEEHFQLFNCMITLIPKHYKVSIWGWGKGEKYTSPENVLPCHVEITFYILKTYLHGMPTIHLPNICASQLPAKCLLPFEAPDLDPLTLSSGWYKSSMIWLMFLCYSHVYKMFFSSVNLSYINLITRPLRKPRRENGESFLPL